MNLTDWGFRLDIRMGWSRGSPTYRGEKKFYFEDPIIFHALRSSSIGAEPYEETLDYLKKEENTLGGSPRTSLRTTW